ncbi:MAG: hypothetical protein ACXVJW_14175 [Acidimicrobiia bacterium]
MRYGATIRTLDRRHGNCITVVFVEALDADHARAQARRIARQRYGCAVRTGTAFPIPDPKHGKESSTMHIPRPASAIRSIGNAGARANAEKSLAASAANRAEVERFVARLASNQPWRSDPDGPPDEAPGVGGDSA